MVTNPPILLIFDIDGTLTDSAGMSRVAYEIAVDKIYRIKKSARGIKADGKTDPLIFFDILQRNGVAYNDPEFEFERFSEVYIQNLGRLLFESDKPKLQPGVKVLLSGLSDHKNIYLALGTGNVEMGAYLKLKRHGIEQLFPVGGFGSDSVERSEIISIAFRRAQHYYHIPFPMRDTWVIGDTPYDIFAGNSLGANTMAVATGSYSIGELEGFKPTAIMGDLSDFKRFKRIIMRK